LHLLHVYALCVTRHRVAHTTHTPTPSSPCDRLAHLNRNLCHPQGDPDAFMAAIGMGWLKRKAVGVALSLGFGSHGYDVVVTEADGVCTVTISVSPVHPSSIIHQHAIFRAVSVHRCAANHARQSVSPAAGNCKPLDRLLRHQLFVRLQAGSKHVTVLSCNDHTQLRCVSPAMRWVDPTATRSV
jgi:hypothetical protein